MVTQLVLSFIFGEKAWKAFSKHLKKQFRALEGKARESGFSLFSDCWFLLSLKVDFN